MVEKPHPINQRKPWLIVPYSDYSTAALEEVLSKLKQRNLNRYATSSFGSEAMIFATELAYGQAVQNSEVSSDLPRDVNRETESTNHKTLDATTEFDESNYIDTLRMQEAKNKPRKVKEVEKSTKEEDKKKKDKCKFKFRDFFKFLHPKKKKCENKTEDPNKTFLEQASVMPTTEIKDEKRISEAVSTVVTTAASINTTTCKMTDKSLFKKTTALKKNRQRRTIDRDNHVTSVNRYNKQKWQISKTNFKKRESTPDNRAYEVLSNKMSYKDFVDGFKYYLNFERDMARSNFSDMVRYQAHKHHNVDDIGKFILEKIPQVPATDRLYESTGQMLEFKEPIQTRNYFQKKLTERLNASTESDSDVRLEKYGSTTLPTAFHGLESLRKRLIDVQGPSWLHKKSISSYFDSKSRNPRIKRGLKPRTQNTIPFETTQFPQTLKSDTAQLRDSTKNVAFAKVHLIETSKTKKPFKGFFEKFKKQKSKRDASGLLKKFRQIFSNGQTTSAQSKGLTARYRYPSNLYDSIKYPMYKAPQMADDLDDIIENFKKAVPRTTTPLASYVDDYDRDPKSSIYPGPSRYIPSEFHGDPAMPFEVTTPHQKDSTLQKKFHKLEKEYDAVAARAMESEYDIKSRKLWPTSATSDHLWKPATLKKPLIENKATYPALHKGGGRLKTVTAPHKYPEATTNDFEYDELQDMLRNNQKQRHHSIHGFNKPAILKSKSKTQDYEENWQINDSELGVKEKEDYNLEDESTLTSSEIPAGVALDDNISVKRYDNKLNNYETNELKTKPIFNMNRLKKKTTRQANTKMDLYNKNCPTRRSNLVHNKATTMNNIEKGIKTGKGRENLAKSLTGKIVKDLLMIQTSTVLIPNEDNARNYDYNINTKIQKNRVSTSKRPQELNKETLNDHDYYDSGEIKNEERVSSKTVGVKDAQSVVKGKTIPVHNALMYGTVQRQKPVAKAKSPPYMSTDKLQQIAFKYPASKYDTILHQKHEKTTPKTRPPPLTQSSTADGSETQSKYDDEDKPPYPKTTDKDTKETAHTSNIDLSDLAHKIDHEIFGFPSKGHPSTTTMKSLIDWFDKHYSVSINIDRKANSNGPFETTSVGALPTNWEPQYIYGDEKTTKSMNPTLNKYKSDNKKIPVIEANFAKNDNKLHAKIDNSNNDYVAQLLKIKTCKPPAKTTTKKDDCTIIDIGKIVKDWMTSHLEIAKDETTTKCKNGKTARDMATYLADNLYNYVTETTTNKNKMITPFNTINAFATRKPEIEKHYFTKKIVFTDNYNSLFDEIPNTKEKMQGYGRPSQNPCFKERPYAVTKSNKANKKTYAKGKYDIMQKETGIKKPLEVEHKVRPEQVKVVHTFDIIYAHGNMPFTNQLALKHKTLKANKYRRRKRFSELSRSVLQYHPGSSG
ncbi:uncharacterized protein LOC125239493 [Leguminivora glycinivorella]|uniref:uncharacterized protein LOC125239493 n=1 Tax=Leguminivora glycinivorella TaxID=1035111 RepID=UPI00200FF0BD|nr:uncharacterized protein LOC125239493 [Leguminivora glycinivorella]